MTKTEDDDKYTARQFNYEDYKGVVFVQSEILCNVQDKPGIPAGWMLLDIQSMVDIICNPKLLSNIGDKKSHLILHWNAGITSMTKKGNLKGYGNLWY